MRAFVQHYAEMVIAMFAGMFGWGQVSRLLWPPAPTPGSAAAGAPTGMHGHGMAMGAGAPLPVWDQVSGIAAMELSMIIPMVLWMRFRGHSWRHGAEMSVAMVVPSIPFYAAGFVWPDVPMVNVWAHVAMLLGMLALMVWQRDMYIGHGHAGKASVPAHADTPLRGGDAPTGAH